MTTTDHPYRGARAALATMHGKDAAIGPPLVERLGLVIFVPEKMDTDRLGTFSGDVERPGSLVETGIAKARMGLVATGTSLGLASEGSYGPHPQMPFLPAGFEVLVLIDTQRNLTLVERLMEPACVFAHETVTPETDLSDFLNRCHFPDHGLIVRAETLPGPVVKGIQDPAVLSDAIAAVCRASSQGTALVQTDMRAHMNPTRMKTLRRLAHRLADRLACLCPRCGAPGFGLMDVERGLPCGLCGAPTRVVRLEIHRCSACDATQRCVPADTPAKADPAQCNLCNP
ncbi:MAG: DUF6671 family protein [Alphaproteobacteria bacterium]